MTKRNEYRLFNEARQQLGFGPITDNVQSTSSPTIVNDPLLVKASRRLHNKLITIPGMKPLAHTLREKRKKQPSIKKTVQTLSLPRPTARPEVSIIIPSFNKDLLALGCIESIIENVSSSIDYEVVLVDNNSTDDTHLLSRIKNIVYVKNDDNLGFVDGCNSGVSASHGNYIVFLNNDALVTPNWLESLYETITSNPSYGIIGSKIIYPDGRLQEAGGIIFSDASGSNYGKYADPSLYSYNYLREVDYCSGASIIISRELFLDKCGGFDKLYAPAYYEDTDLCFKVRGFGYKVIYQPKSVIYHIEGATSGTNLTSGFKKYQAINQKKFVKRWGKTLKNDHQAPGEIHKGRDRSGDKLAFIIDDFVPTPDKDSGSVRMFAIIRILKDLGYKVSFFFNPSPVIETDPKYIADLQDIGVEVIYRPCNIVDIAKTHGADYDMVLMSRPQASTYIDIIQMYFTNAKIVYDTVDLHYLRIKRQAKIERLDSGKLTQLADTFEAIEKGMMLRTETTLVVSPVEKSILEDEAPGVDVKVLSNIHVLDENSYSHGFDDRHDLLFVGSYGHQPNVDAIKWFVDDIFPLIRKKLPMVSLHVVGSQMSEDLEKSLSKKPGVIVHGFVENLTPILRSARVFVSPLRYGAGVKGKIGQAIEHGVPVVSSDIGVEGMHLENGVSCLVANDADKFASDVAKLYNDTKLWNKLRSNGRQALEKNLGIQSAVHAIKQL